jgi:transposase-like protein
MNEQNEINETSEDQDIKRWTAKCRATLVLEILRGHTTIADAARTHGLKASDIELWKDTFLTYGENTVCSNPYGLAIHKFT